MNSQARTEMLSAYVDGELSRAEIERVERLLESDPAARQQLEGMRSVVHNLGHLQRMAPPSTLGQDVARRIALASERRSLLDRIEDGLAGSQRHSNLFMMFALVFALSIITFFFLDSLNRAGRETLQPITFDDPATAPLDVEALEKASTVIVGGRIFQRAAEGPWIEDGIDPGVAAEAPVLDLQGSPGIAAQDPRLRGLAVLEDVVLRLDGKVVRVKSAEPR